MSFAADIAASDVIDGVRIVTPSVGRDARGTIWTSWDRSISDALLPDGPAWCHDKFSQSAEGVLRGIHGDTKSWKLVTCVAGEIFQVVADLREGSPSYLKWQGFRISPEDQRLVLIPPGCVSARAHCPASRSSHFTVSSRRPIPTCRMACRSTTPILHHAAHL